MDGSFCVLKGPGIVGSGGEQHTAGPGSPIDSPARIPHCRYNEGDQTLCVLVVKFPWLTGQARLLPGDFVREFGENTYTVNLWLALPITALTGLAAGAVGISGGSFKVPLMVLACGVPMRIAVGTSSIMVAATAAMGLAGHASQGHFDAHWALPMACVAVLGGILGSRFALKTQPKNLKTLFAITTLAAAVFMAANAFLSGAGD